MDGLNQQINDQKGRIKELDALIVNYQKQIANKESETATLENQLGLLDNQVEEKQLDIQRTTIEISALNLEIKLISSQISTQEGRIERQKDLLADLISNIHQSDEVSAFDVLLTKPSLSEFFAHVEEIKRLQTDLDQMLRSIKVYKTDLESRKQDRQDKEKALQDEQHDLKQQQLALEAEHNLKSSLVSETKNKEQNFQNALYELQQQQQSAGNDIAELENKLKESLDNIDQSLARGDILLNWPVDPSRGITAIFHDPTYPFRNIFEHPGTDIRASVGTPVKAAAGGYVAWNKMGRLYGNYTMIVHPGGIATVYAHLSKFVAKPDTFVQRRDIIGMSGGRPGDPGAGLSTGPHLHFEVRQDGIPVNAENYLPSIPNDYYDYYSDYRRLHVRP